MALAQADSWIAQGHNLLTFGLPGTGKTHLMAGIGHALIERGHKVLLSHTSELVQRLQAARRDLGLPAALTKLDRFDLLVLDDFSYAKRDQAETSVLFELICERYERKSIAITANAPFSEWDQVFADKAMTVAAVDRLSPSRHHPGDECGELPTPRCVAGAPATQRTSGAMITARPRRSG